MVVNLFHLCQHLILVDRFNGNLDIKSLDTYHLLDPERVPVRQPVFGEGWRPECLR